MKVKTITCIICDTEVLESEITNYSAFGGLPSPCCNICFRVNDYSIKSLQELKVKSLKKREEENE